MPRVSLVVLLATLTAFLDGGQASFFDPHLPSFSPSWAEGWYLRIVTDLDSKSTDKSAPRSLGIVFGETPSGLRAWNSSEVMLLIQQESGDPLKIKENVNLEFNVTYHGDIIQDDPDISTPPDFEVTAASSDWNSVLHASFNNEDCSIAAAIGNKELGVTCSGDSEPYGPDFESPEGPLFSRFPTGIVGLHWYVLSMRTPVMYTLRTTDSSSSGSDDEYINGKGWMHAEKNWGESFPDSWIWAQGISQHRSKKEDGKEQKGGAQQTSFVLAGGVPPSPLLPSGLGPEIYLAAVHVGDQLQWRFHPWDPTAFSVKAESCGDSGDPEPFATLKFNVVQPLQSREVEFFIKAPLDSFSGLNCPTKHGFAPDSDHSYTGLATVKLYTLKECQGFGCKKERVLIHSEVLEDVALEFGGDRRCEYKNKISKPEVWR
ncbi:hypothetical protein Ndes2437B_g05798 [Nannochloris sp. 'desiccata']|nr:hypothetical protein KSW81_007770 [Chlorella desiccata (nom. nud.)]